MLQRIEADHSLAGGPIRAIPTGSAGRDRRISHAFEALAIDFLYARDDALERMTTLVADWRGHAGPATRLPGERSQRARAYSTAHGIPYSHGQVQTLGRCGALAGTGFTLRARSVGAYPRHLFTK
jgi:LDH2 family malate/lactate/ureidoglycolate dehydrogenase